MVFNLFKRDESNAWVQYYLGVEVETTNHGLLIRELVSHLLVADCPKTAFLAIEILPSEPDDFVVRIVFTSHPPLALATKSKIDMDSLIVKFRQCGLQIQTIPSINIFSTTSNFMLPNLQSKLVQRYLIELQLSPKFNKFVLDLELFLTNELENYHAKR
jgi:hypothetical protein